MHVLGETDTYITDNQDPSSPSSQDLRKHRGVCTICAADAVTIFMSKKSQNKRDRLASRLAEEFGITAKAVRDIWNLRTWAQVTKQHWSAADYENFLNKRLCLGCRNRRFTSIQQACSTCRTNPVKRCTATLHMCHRDAPTVIDSTPPAPIQPPQPINTDPDTAVVPLPQTNLHMEPRQCEDEWMFDVALVARAFEEIFDEWQTIAEALRAEQII